MSERVVQSLGISRHAQSLTISGIGGVSHKSSHTSVSTLEISSLCSSNAKYVITAIIAPHVTCDLPLQPMYDSRKWDHLSNITLADPDFSMPGKIDLLLGADVYSDVLLHGRRCGQPNTPTASQTHFGWVLTGRTQSRSHSANYTVTSHHTAVASGDDILRKFWEIEESPKDHVSLSPEECIVMSHFKENHSRSIVSLPRSSQSKQLGESRSQAVRRFYSLERSLYAKGQFQEFA